MKSFSEAFVETVEEITGWFSKRWIKEFITGFLVIVLWLSNLVSIVCVVAIIILNTIFSLHLVSFDVDSMIFAYMVISGFFSRVCWKMIE